MYYVAGKTSQFNDDEIGLNYHKLTCFPIIVLLFSTANHFIPFIFQLLMRNEMFAKKWCVEVLIRSNGRLTTNLVC